MSDNNFFGSLKRLFQHKETSLEKYKENRLRPPGAVEESLFMALCIRCNRCLEVCPYHSIVRAGLGKTIGTPFVSVENKACYLCMACTRLCPTGALEAKVTRPEQVNMGRAVIDATICYSHLFLEHDVLPDTSGKKIGALCNTCYNVCPLQDQAILLKRNLFPVITDKCIGCGICVERCPTRPRRSINVIPTGMGRVDEAGFYFNKARHRYKSAESAAEEKPGKVLGGEKLLEKKYQIDSGKGEIKFDFPYSKPGKPEGWE